MAGLNARVFEWCPFLDSGHSTDFKVRSSQFGDGYRQVAGDGINSVKDSINITIIGDRAKIDTVSAFIDDHKGAVPFAYTHYGLPESLYLCDGYSVTPQSGKLVWQLSCTFEEFTV